MSTQTKPLKVKKSRNANYKLTKMNLCFEPIDPDNVLGTCGNIQRQIEPIDLIDYAKSFGAKVSAPYVLARLCALFEGLKINTGGQEFYKITWETALRHKPTGNIVTFYDYKGGISYGSNVYGPEVQNEFINDLRDLLKDLSNDRFPHPYDGCVVGEIA